MSLLRKFFPSISPILMIIVALALVGFAITAAPFVYAQSMIADQSAGFEASITNASTTVVISATTIDKSTSGPPVISPSTGAPGFSVANARVRLKHIHLYASAACAINIFEHPATGSDILICTVGVAQTTPYDVSAGQNSILGVSGYLTKAGSSIKLGTNATSSTKFDGTCTFDLE